MRHLRLSTAFLAMAAIAVACSSPTGSGGQSQAASSQGAASAPAASSGGGGGGGGVGTGSGSLHYDFTGDVSKSGDLAFTYINGGISVFDSTTGGWVAYFYSEDQNTVVQLNTTPDSGIFNFGDGEVLIVGTKDTGCSFNFSQNDASGLKGTIDCENTLAVNNTSGAQLHTNVHATVDAHT